MSAPRILLVEDEFITLDDLRDALTDLGYNVTAAVMNATDAITELEKGETDLAILDIHLRGSESGIWIGRQIKDRFRIPFLYLTAFGDKGTIAAAAEVEPAAYLVKPFSVPDITAAIELALARRVAVSQPAPDTPGRLRADENIFVKDELMFRRIAVKDILFAQSFRNYLEIQTAGGRYVVRSTLQDFANLLPADLFLQSHRSYLVNWTRIDGIGGNFVRVGEHEVPLSRGERAGLLRRLSTFG